MADLNTALTVKAYVLYSQQKDNESRNCLRAALANEPDRIAALFLRGLIELTQGRDGWQLFDLRHTKFNACDNVKLYQHVPRWDGKPTKQRVIIWAEDWLGDVVQMLRYMPEVLLLAPNAMLHVPPALKRLCEYNSMGQVIMERPRLPFGMVQCPILSLPGIFGRVWAGKYLDVPPWLCDYWRKMLQGFPRIGLCWKGDQSNVMRDSVRSIHDAALIDSFGGDVDFVSLHRDTKTFEDVEALAAIISNLDLVITVDTLQAHVAGALGKPVWIMLSVDCDWRWMRERQDSPWYPTARLFRQKIAGDWAGVLADVKEALNARTLVAA